MKKKTNRLLSLFLSLVMVLGLLPTTAGAYYESPFFDGQYVDVCTEGKTYSLFTEDNLEGQNGTTFLYVVKSGDRYYTPANPRYTEFKEVDSVSAIDITEYYDAQSNSFSGISNNVNVGVMQYQMNSGSYMYVDGDMLFALSVPFESEGNEWFDGGIRYYSPDETYSYSRPSWHTNGDGTGYFYDSYIDWMSDSDVWVYGVLDLKYTGTSYVFALRDKSAEYTEAKNAEPDNYNISVGSYAYLYAAPCGHEQNVHGNADTPTCMEKGCKEYWYCRLCDTYFSNEEMTVAYDGFPEISALGHDFDSEKCNNCNRPVPVYSKVTNKTDFFALEDDTMYVLVAEYEGKYYTPDSSVLYSYVFDLDNDGYADIYTVDENNNGTPDVAEIDYNKNGVYDLWDYPTEEERREYFDSICQGYLTDMLYGQTVGIPVKEITLNSNDTISHNAVKDALEFEMIKLHSQEEIDEQEEVFRYGYECVMQFVVPNTFINSPAFIPEDRPYNKLYPDEADTYYWAVLFYNDRDSYYTYDWENDTYVGGLPFLDICKEGSIALSKSNSSFALGWDSQLECLRLRDYDGKLSFVVGNDYVLEGSEWVDDDTHEDGGYYNTNDTQACVYLYASEGTGSSGGDDDTCSHEIHEAPASLPTCTEPGKRLHFFCAKCEKYFQDQDGTVEVTEDDLVTNDALGHDWGEWEVMDSNPTKEQRVCNRDASHIEERDAAAHVHSWSDWTPDGDENHKRTCSAEGCTANTETQPHAWDEGRITTQPTCVAEGAKTYTCETCGHTKTESVDADPAKHNFSDWESISDTQHSRSCQNAGCTVTETADHTLEGGVIQAETCETDGQAYYSCTTCGYEKFTTRPALGHDYGDWTVVTPATETTEGLEQRVCANDNSHVEERTIPVLTHTHTIQTVAAKAADCMNPGNIACYQCSGCQRYFSDAEGATELNEEDVIIAALGHDWSDWTDTGENAPADVHTRSCQRSCGVANEIGNHEWSRWTDDGDTNHKKTCSVCSGTRTAAHTFGDWLVQDAGSLKRTCTAVACDAYETLAVNAPTGEILVDNKTTPTANDAAADLLIEAPADIINDILTEEDVEKVQEGAAISVYLQVEDISNTVGTTEAATASGAAAEVGAQIGMYLDIDLYKAVTASGSTVKTQVTETNDHVTISIVVPDELINTDPNVTRVYSIVRVHAGWAEIIYGEFDPATKTLTFQTNKFSTYALAYSDTSMPVYDDYEEPTFRPVVEKTEGGTVRVSPRNPEQGDRVTITATPDTGCEIDQVIVTDRRGNEIEVRANGNGTYTFRQPYGKVTIEVIFAEVESAPVFDDVERDDYYFDAIRWAVANGITNGTSKTMFSPEAACTRAQMVTFLWRAAGCPEPAATDCKLTDVDMDSYYGKAVLWAIENGITNGTSATTFGPDAACTRGQMAAFLCRMAGGKAAGSTDAFADVKADAYYAEAVQWAVENGVTNGTGDNKFSPDAVCTRGQMVTFLYRYFVK